MPKKIAGLLIFIILILVATIGWLVGRSDKADAPSQNSSAASPTPQPADASGLRGAISYALPDGWSETSCPSVQDAVYIIPAGSAPVNCSANPSAPVKVSIDPGDTKDCNELQNVQQVKKHICISQFINDMRSLKANTEYLSSSSYGRGMTVDAYYIDTGKSVVKFEHVYPGSDGFSMGFEQLVASAKTR